MILVDSSAWIEFLRGTQSRAGDRVAALLSTDIAICDAIRMEVLAGARDDAHLVSLRRLLARAVVLPTTPTHYDDAAMLFRTCRRQGETVRKLVDCLIAAHAIREGIPILHADKDFDAIARHSSLVVESP